MDAYTEAVLLLPVVDEGLGGEIGRVVAVCGGFVEGCRGADRRDCLESKGELLADSRAALRRWWVEASVKGLQLAVILLLCGEGSVW